MGTRALIHFHEGDASAPILTTVYCQFDGYLSGLGDEIKRALIGADGTIRKLVNGYSDGANQINGMGNLTALVIAKLFADRARDGCGGVYVRVPGEADCGEAFVYHLYQSDGSEHERNVVMLRADAMRWINQQDVPETLFDGPLSEFDGDALEKGGDA